MKRKYSGTKFVEPPLFQLDYLLGDSYMTEQPVLVQSLVVTWDILTNGYSIELSVHSLSDPVSLAL